MAVIIPDEDEAERRRQLLASQQVDQGLISGKVPDPTADALQQFLRILGQEPEPAPVPEAPSFGAALRGAFDPDFFKRKIEPALAAQTPQAQAAVAAEARATRLRELQGAIGVSSLAGLRGAQAGAIPETTAARTLTAQAAMARAQRALAAGGRIRSVLGVDQNGQPVTSFVVDGIDPDTGQQTLFPLPISTEPQGGAEAQGGAQAPGAGQNFAIARPTSGVPLTGATGEQQLVNRFTGQPIGPARLKSPSPGIQQAAAQAISTIAGFNDFSKVYANYRATQLPARPSKVDELIGQVRGTISETFPKATEVLDPATSRFIAARRGALNRYIKAVTGAQFSIKELERYESQLPGPGASPGLANFKIKILLNQNLEILRSLILQNGGLRAMIDNPKILEQLGLQAGLSLDSGQVDPAAMQAFLDGAHIAAEDQETAGVPTAKPKQRVANRAAGTDRSTGKPLFRLPDGRLTDQEFGE